MKRLIPLMLALVLGLSLLSGCGNPGADTTLIPSDPPGETASVPPADNTEEPTLALPTEEPTAEPTPEPTEAPATNTPEAKPTPKPTPAPTPKPTPEPPAGVDLAAFYEDVTNMHEFGPLQLADSTLLDGYYPGLSSIPTEQRLVYICPMTMNNGEFGLVQVKNSADAARVKAIFQARIDQMVGTDDNPGAAWYPGAIESWHSNSRVVSNGNYVMMVVHENCDEIVSLFNALF